jgi:PAS domain S-box-containing protein
MLECTCGLVLTGRTDPSMSCFTRGGSFWTNVSSELLALPREVDPRTNPRNRCIHTGYESVGLFPVRSCEEIIGLLQLNDRMAGRFTPGTIAFYEALAQNIGLALQRAAAEEAMRQSEKRYRSYIKVAEQLGWITDAEGEVVEDIPSWREFTGQSFEEVRGWGWASAIHPDDLEGSVREWRNAVTLKKSYETEYRIRRYDGAYRHFLARGVPVYSDNGDTREWVGTCIDITDRKKMEKDLRKARDELEITVETRTAELKKANEQLQQRNRDLEEFVYLTSHDFQEPLRKIQVFADLLGAKHQPLLEGEVRDYIERMRESAKRSRTLVQSLLRYSTVTSRLQTLTTFNLREPVEEALADFGAVCEETGGRIEVGELPDIQADRIQMRHLFRNLIDNALKYRSQKNPLVKIYSKSFNSQPFWEIHVGDNGIGFDESYLDKIFKPFQRLHGIDSPYEGAGMGLAICRRIAEQHGGKITAKSELGKGSTFIVTFPSGEETR